MVQAKYVCASQTHVYCSVLTQSCIINHINSVIVGRNSLQMITVIGNILGSFLPSTFLHVSLFSTLVYVVHNIMRILMLQCTNWLLSTCMRLTM